VNNRPVFRLGIHKIVSILVLMELPREQPKPEVLVLMR